MKNKMDSYICVSIHICICVCVCVSATHVQLNANLCNVCNVDRCLGALLPDPADQPVHNVHNVVVVVPEDSHDASSCSALSCRSNRRLQDLHQGGNTGSHHKHATSAILMSSTAQLSESFKQVIHRQLFNLSPQILGSKGGRCALAHQLPHGVARLLTEHVHLALAFALGEAIGLIRLLNRSLPLSCEYLQPEGGLIIDSRKLWSSRKLIVNLALEVLRCEPTSCCSSGEFTTTMSLL